MALDWIPLEQRKRLAAQRAAPLAAPAPELPELTPEEERSLIGELAQRTGQTLDNVAWLLDTPGAIVRSGVSALTGGEAGNPFGSWEDRVSGEDLLKQWGLQQEADTTMGKVGNFLAGVGTELAFDPLSYLSGPAKALTLAGRAGEAANLTGDAAKVVSKKLLPALNAGEAVPDTARLTKAALDKAGVPLTEGALSARPLVGKRYALRNTSLDELVGALPPEQRAGAIERVNTFLSKSGKTFEDVRGEQLAKTVGVGMPMMDTTAAFDVFGKAGGDRIADAMDYLGQAAGWSPVGRAAGAVFQQKTNGTMGVADQVQAIRMHQLREAGGRAADSLNARMVVTMQKAKAPDAWARATGADSLFTQQGNDALTRLIELPEDQWNATDRLLYEGSPEVQSLLNDWDEKRKHFITESEKWGIGSNELEHPYGIRYLPAQQTEQTLLNGGSSAGRGRDYSTMTPDQLKRSAAFKVPGGRETLRALSIDPQIAGLGRTLKTDEAAAGYIRDRLLKDFDVDFPLQNARALAVALRNIPEQAVKEGISIFGTHPVEDIARYTLVRNRALNVAQGKIEALADFAKPQPSQLVEDGGYVNASQALNDLRLLSTRAEGYEDAYARARGKALELKKADDAIDVDAETAKFLQAENGDFTDDLIANDGVINGATIRLKEAIAKRNNVDPKSVDLSQHSVPKSLVDRLNRTMDAYEAPEIQTMMGRAFDQVTKIWKGGVLTWPSRYVRDLYSGIVSNYIETGDIAGVLQSSVQARNLLVGNNDAFTSFLGSIPKYSGIADPQDRLKEFLVDAGSSRIFSGSMVEDFATANRTGQTAQELIPGFSPAGPMKILGQEFAPKQRKWGEFLQDFGTIKGVRGSIETKNPLYRAGERLGDYTDGINRLTGYIALLRQGVDPMAAAKRIAAAQVDYGSLTKMERGLISGVLFPFWAYTSRMGAYITQQLAERPGGRYGQIVQGVNDSQRNESEDGTYVPDSIKEQVGWKWSDSPEGSTFLTDIDLPGFDQINMIKPGAGVFDAERTFQSLAQQSNPIIRSAMEHATGTNFFYKKPLGSPGTESGLDKISIAMGGDRLPAAVNTLANFVPFVGRSSSAIGQLMDTRQPLENRIPDFGVNVFTGVKRRYVPNTAQLYDIQKKVEQDLGGRMATNTQMYVPQDELTRLSPDQQKLYSLYKSLQSTSRKINKAKREGTPLPQMPF